MPSKVAEKCITMDTTDEVTLNENQYGALVSLAFNIGCGNSGSSDLIRLLNVGQEVHSMHLHGMTFLVVAKDGQDLPLPYRADTVLIGPGERYDLLVKGRDGTFPFHDHIPPHGTNDGVDPGGIHLMVVGHQGAYKYLSQYLPVDS